MAPQNKRSLDELFAFLTLLSNDQQLKLKYFSLESRQVRRDFIATLGFNPDLIRESLSEIPIKVGLKTTNLLDFLISKGVDEDTPLPVGIVLSALRSAGSDSSFAPIEASFSDFQAKLGSSAGGSAPQPRSIESVDPRDADRLVERDVVDTSRDQGLSDFKDTAPSRELSRDSGDEFSALSRSNDDVFSSTPKFNLQSSDTKPSESFYSLSRFDQHNDQLRSFSSERSDLISSLIDRPSNEIVSTDQPIRSDNPKNDNRSDSQKQPSDISSLNNSGDKSFIEQIEAASKSGEIREDKQENALLSKEFENLQKEDPQLLAKYKEAMDSSDADKFMSNLAKDLADAKISPQETIDLLHSFLSATLTRLRNDPSIPQDVLDRFVDSKTKTLDEKESDIAALNEAVEKTKDDQERNQNTNQSQDQPEDTSKWLKPTLTALNGLIHIGYRVGVGWRARAQWQQALKDAREGKTGDTDNS